MPEVFPETPEVSNPRPHFQQKINLTNSMGETPVSTRGEAKKLAKEKRIKDLRDWGAQFVPIPKANPARKTPKPTTRNNRKGLPQTNQPTPSSTPVYPPIGYNYFPEETPEAAYTSQQQGGVHPEPPPQTAAPPWDGEVPEAEMDRVNRELMASLHKIATQHKISETPPTEINREGATN